MGQSGCWSARLRVLRAGGLIGTMVFYLAVAVATESLLTELCSVGCNALPNEMTLCSQAVSHELRAWDPPPGGDAD